MYPKYVLPDHPQGISPLTSHALFTPHGLIGFTHIRHYELTPLLVEGNNGWFWQLKAEEGHPLRFIILPAEVIASQLVIEKSDIEEALLHHQINASPSCLQIFYMATIKPKEERGSYITLNIRAPLVVDPLTYQAWQLILQNAKYPIRYPLAEK